MINPAGSKGDPSGIFGSGAILLYLGDKTRKFLSLWGRACHRFTGRLLWQMGGVAAMLGQLGFGHHFDGREIEAPRPRERHCAETRRLPGMPDRQIEGRDRSSATCSLAGIATIGSRAPEANNAATDEPTAAGSGRHCMTFFARPAAQRGLRMAACGSS
ncbi:hypothetical protein [Paracoccus sp. S1E-3]|uniref:hypothetical protein n=1 Tax=Paracoccus sp. S1E-3 TaxID=2756130 RepID=UPI0015EEBE5E|nr:hypothetical protein [Paracoccus sp. S1E-3]MBA4490522.1 hypothetical protein [Paracoccus sp. S1E-3]